MSKERKFHELIEQQNREEKDRVWAKLQQKEAERLAMEKQAEEAKQAPTFVLQKAAPFSWRKWAAVAASSLAVIIFSVFAMVKFFPWDMTASNNSSSSEGGERYFDTHAYDIVETQITLQSYAQEIGKDLLYFDWYAETDYLKNDIWQLKDTQEIICFNEEIIDINTGCMVYVFVTEAKTRLESFSFDENTNFEAVIKDIQINWSITEEMAYVNFEYEDYRYYLRVQEPIDEDYVLNLVEELLS